MKLAELAKVGEASGWINLSDVLVVLLGHEPEKDFEKQVDERCKNISIKVRALKERDKRRMAAASADTEFGTIEQLDIDREAMEAGLVEIQGTDVVTVDSALYDALEASDYSWLIAAAVRNYNALLPEVRAAYFTQARAELSTSAKDAALS